MEDRINQAIVQTHISTLQNVISRMANSSLNCKTWAITLITGIIVILFDKTKSEYFYIAFIPLLLFYFLDCYYLGLEKAFRRIYSVFIQEIESNNGANVDISFSLKGIKGISFLRALYSISTLPFYIIMTVAILMVGIFVK
jgi:hypothetical protein